MSSRQTRGCLRLLNFATVLLGAPMIRAEPSATEPSPSHWSWYAAAQVYSFHEHTTDVYLHNTTPGLGLMARYDDWLAGAGIFRNSLGRWAGLGYAGWQLPLGHFRSGPVRAGGIVGVSHHYKWHNGGPVPLAAGVLTIPLSQTVGVQLVGIPRVSRGTSATLNTSLTIRFR